MIVVAGRTTGRSIGRSTSSRTGRCSWTRSSGTLGRAGAMNVDELRRGIESMPPERVRAGVVLRALALLGGDGADREGCARTRDELRDRPATRAHLGAKPRWPPPHSRLHQGEDRHDRRCHGVVHEPRDTGVRSGRASRAGALPRCVSRTARRTASTSTSSSTGWRRPNERRSRPRPRPDHERRRVAGRGTRARARRRSRREGRHHTARSFASGSTGLCRGPRRRRAPRRPRLGRSGLQAAPARDAREAALELGLDPGPSPIVVALENTEHVHHMVVCTLCSCYPKALLGPPPDWYKSLPYRSRAVSDPRGVLREFGVELADDVEVRVVDSTADIRYLVIPPRPAGSEAMPEDELASLVTRDSMIGVALPREPTRSCSRTLRVPRRPASGASAARIRLRARQQVAAPARLTPSELAEAVFGHAHARHGVVHMRVEAGGHYEQIRLEAFDCGRNGVLERLQVLLVSGSR